MATVCLDKSLNEFFSGHFKNHFRKMFLMVSIKNNAHIMMTLFL